MRQRCAVMLVFFVTAMGLLGCGSDTAFDPSDTAIKVNKVTISIEEFNEQIKMQAYSDPEMTLTRENRQQYVDYLIRKELMIQEAIRLKMDRNDEFIKTIETYWESTLIRRLLDYKTAELKKKILITEDEVAAYYAQHKDEYDQPFEMAKTQIQKQLESKKLEAEIGAWTQNLREKANISINPSLTTGSK